MTAQEKKHTDKLLSILKRAVKELNTLSDSAIENDAFPLTTKRALLEVQIALGKAEVRILTGRADAI